MASFFVASLLIALVVSAPNTAAAAPSPSVVDGSIASTTLEMQRARYFTFVMLIRMVQEKIPHNTTFLMPNDRLLSTASVPKNQVLDLSLRHSILAQLTFDDLIRLPSGTIIPTHHSSQMITITNREHQKLYFNNIELTSPNVCRGGNLFRCHGINGVIRPIAPPRGKGVSLPSLHCSNNCSTRASFSSKPILGDVFSNISQHGFFHESSSHRRNFHHMVIPQLSSCTQTEQYR